MFISCQDSQKVSFDGDEQSLELRSECDGDLSQQEFCGEIKWREINNYQHPFYPGCTFNISVPYLECTGAIDLGIFIGQYIMNSHDCEQYQNDLLNAMNPDEEAMIEFRTNLDVEVEEDLGPMLAWSFARGRFDCSTNSIKKNAFVFQSAQCKATCKRQIDENLNGHNTINCASTNCCSKRFYVCYDYELNDYVVTSYILNANGGGTCSDINFPQGPAVTIGGDPVELPTANNCTYITTCSYTCQ